MRQATSNRAIAVAALAAAVALIAAGPARANNEFENGFEDQLGRIAAFGAVNLGLQILTGGYYPAVVPVPVAAVAYYGPKAVRHGRYCGPRNGYYGKQYGYHDGNRSHAKHSRKGYGRSW